MVDENKRLLYNVKEMRAVLGIGRGLAYQLLAQRDFPKIIINGRYYIPAEKLKKWIDKQASRNIQL